MNEFKMTVQFFLLISILKQNMVFFLYIIMQLLKIINNTCTIVLYILRLLYDFLIYRYNIILNYLM